jgi:signal transduction histidine kinase
MWPQVELACAGTVAVLDTVLLVALVERRNWQYARLPVVLLIAGSWLWHAGNFIHLLLITSPPPARQLQWPVMTLMALGLLLIPSALVHVCGRLLTTGLRTSPVLDWRYACAYVPLVAIVPVSSKLAANPAAGLLAAAPALVPVYGALLGVVHLFAAAVFFRCRTQLDAPSERQFLGRMAVVMLLLGVVQPFILLYGLRAWPEWQRGLTLAVVVAPALPALLFGYFVLRYNFMQVIVERAVVYGAIVVGMMLWHTLVFRDLTDSLSQRYRVDVGILEGAAILLLVIVYPPLRQRVAESLRYLMGSRVAATRERLREASLQMAAWAGDSPKELSDWFLATLCDALTVDYAGLWLFDDQGRVWLRCGPDERPQEVAVAALMDRMELQQVAACSPRHAIDPPCDEFLRSAGISLAVRVAQHRVRAMLLVGRRRSNLDLGDEETNAVTLLAEQWGASLHNSMLHADRLSAERRALQNEKLAALGLLAGSIAHEVKNPLSSIKMIATVLAERLPHGDDRTEDLRVILDEVDRLALTTTQLLQFARPATNGAATAGRLFDGVLHLMRHLARQRDVRLEIEPLDSIAAVRVDAAAQEVLFNLLSNSIDAAGTGGMVSVACRAEAGLVTLRIHDSGRGIPPRVRDRLFEPFVSTKESGTGLGLYVVGRRVREMGGEIHCESGPDHGTTFTVRLPCHCES